jgi:hypothetical protein
MVSVCAEHRENEARKYAKNNPSSLVQQRKSSGGPSSFAFSRQSWYLPPHFICALFSSAFHMQKKNKPRRDVVCRRERKGRKVNIREPMHGVWLGNESKKKHTTVKATLRWRPSFSSHTQ